MINARGGRKRWDSNGDTNVSSVRRSARPQASVPLTCTGLSLSAAALRAIASPLISSSFLSIFSFPATVASAILSFTVLRLTSREA